MKKKIVFIGNSIVNGFPFKRSQCFVSLVREASGYDIINKGKNGETTADILSRFQHDVIAHRPDIVFIMTGTNDFIYGERTPHEAFDNMMTMRNAALCENIKTVFITPLPVDAKLASDNWIPSVDYNHVNVLLSELRRFIVESGVPYIDLGNYDSECGMYHDGVHPLPEGHQYIAEIVLTRIDEEN